MNQRNNKNWNRTIELLNYEGAIFKIVRGTRKGAQGERFDIIDYYGKLIAPQLTTHQVLSYYNGLQPITTSDGRTYNLANEHSNAKPTLNRLLDFLDWGEEPERDADNLTIHYQLSNQQQMRYLDWLDSIKTLYGHVGELTWTIQPGSGAIKVKSSVIHIELDLTQ
jgi:hypothetical protein